MHIQCLCLKIRSTPRAYDQGSRRDFERSVEIAANEEIWLAELLDTVEKYARLFVHAVFADQRMNFTIFRVGDP